MSLLQKWHEHSEELAQLSKVFAIQTQGPEFDPQNSQGTRTTHPPPKLDMVACACDPSLGEADKQFPRAHWQPACSA